MLYRWTTQPTKCLTFPFPSIERVPVSVKYELWLCIVLLMLMRLCVPLLVLHAFVHSISWWGNWLMLKLSWQRPLTVWWRKSQMNKQTERQTLLQHTPHYALLHMCWVIKTINPWQFKCNTNKKTELIFIFLKCCISSTSIMCIVIDINYMAYCAKTFCICSP